ncbi:N-acetyltransferase [Bacillus sp. 165]|uniref:N-acetyltransferase n=1 Tax=Bacillus sp. 165 TaxID=1529117 RepID=UPI001ADBE64C|nr:N-acetyltransferase [Bacillus sp. 165]MBO9130274.1 N-acetyltransferase [Bacillus sp. 165]
MYIPKVERLLVNYKTLEEFKKFKGCGAQELSMLEDLQENIIEDNSESPFYGIYYGGSLVARMSLYVTKPYEYSIPKQEYLELFKLEVLPTFQKKGFGRSLVDYAKSLNMPIKTTARVNSEEFWQKQGFQKTTNHEGTVYLWYPETKVNTVSNGESA